MIIVKKANDLQVHLHGFAEKNKQPRGVTAGIGFVPTMGALHAGHLSLISASIAENQLTVCSIFVNPAQFNDPNDFKKYPATLEHDIYALETNGCDVLFLPDVVEIYPGGINRRKHYDLGYLETILEGKYRPGHFQGVCMAVERLLQIVQPGKLYLGQKDYQQCLVIARLIDIMELTGKIQTRICPILREPDGLAMSSRNMRLDNEERERAPAIYDSLDFIKQNHGNIPLSEIKKQAIDRLQKRGLSPDYVEIADAQTLNSVHDWHSAPQLLALVAAYVDSIRLIDNVALN